MRYANLGRSTLVPHQPQLSTPGRPCAPAWVWASGCACATTTEAFLDDRRTPAPNRLANLDRSSLTTATQTQSYTGQAHRPRLSASSFSTDHSVHSPSPTTAPILPFNPVDAWLESLTRASAASHCSTSSRCTMSDHGDAPELPLPAPDPDAQTTVNDFLDYTEFFPSDLVRSLTLIGDLDSTYRDHVQQVHELTVLYGKLPALAEQDRPDPVALRRTIARYLQTAINQREYAFTEASRLYEVALRHCKRSNIIKKKLQAQPEPPSRDPTPAPVSPSAHRPAYRSYIRPPHLRLTFDTGRHAANTSRPRDRNRKPPGSHSRGRRHIPSDSDDSDLGSTIDVVSPRKHKPRSERPPKSSRSRPPGVLGTNVHSSIAGISTSNALAQLAPPPPDARPGSKWAPWMKLTEYEMAVLRKQMKKNAVWTPSQTMVTRELEKKHRTEADFERERQRCEETGEEFLNEEPETLQQLMNASGLGQLAPSGPLQSQPQIESVVDGEGAEETGPVSIRLKPIDTKDGKRLDRLSQRQQAMRDAQELLDATEKVKEAANGLKELTFASPAPVTTPTSQKKKASVRSSNKRKRDASPHEVDEADLGRDASVATEESALYEPEAKRVRLEQDIHGSSATASPLSRLASNTPTLRDSENDTDRDEDAHEDQFDVLNVQDGEESDHQHSDRDESRDADEDEDDRHDNQDRVLDKNADDPESSVSSPVVGTPLSTRDPDGKPNGDIVQVPRGPVGPATPKVEKTSPRRSSLPSTPTITTPTPESSPDILAPAQPQPAQMVSTAASSRSRRESVAAKVSSPSKAASVVSVKHSNSSTPAPESKPEPVPLRPRSARGHVPTPKAQSEEPKPNEGGRALRETRRHSIFSQPSLAEPGQSAVTRTSSRRKPPPKGEVSATEDGQKSVTRVKRAQGSKNRKKKKVEEETGQGEDIDEDETRYCICDDISHGDMIYCDNNVSRSRIRSGC